MSRELCASLGMNPQGLVLVQEQSLGSARPFPNPPHPRARWSFVFPVSCMGVWSWIHPKSWSIHTQEPPAPARAVLACPCCVPWMNPLPSALTFLCIFLPLLTQEFQAGLRSPWLFRKEAGLRLSPKLCPPGLVAAALAVQSGSCGPFPAVLVPTFPRTRHCSCPSLQEFPLSPWQRMKSPGHRMCLCTFCWGRRREGAELCFVSSTLVFSAFLFPPPRN